MWRKALIPLSWLLLGAACSIGPNLEAERPRPEDRESFVALVQEDLAGHAWQSLLASSDPHHYQLRVVEGETPEPQYVAELFGLTREGNTIQDGPTLEWADLERIETVTLVPAGDEGPPYLYTGRATLESGSTLQLETRVTQVQGRFVLTGAGG